MSSKPTSFAKTRTTYRASTHPKWRNLEPKPDAIDIPISIIVQPALTFGELCAMRDGLIAKTGPASNGSNGSNDVWTLMQALTKEVNRCTPKPAWMRRPNDPSEPLPPTQHACIDPAQAAQLNGILKPETLRRTFMSINALMNEIQNDIVLLSLSLGN
jgi:hypothetical protein